MRYVILERTPFPGHFQPMATCHLQAAEFMLDFNRLCYHERAVQVGSLLLYTLEDAERIINWRALDAPYAEFRVYGYWGVVT